MTNEQILFPEKIFLRVQKFFLRLLPMNKRKQKLFIDDTLQELGASGTKIGWFLKKIEISRTHWFFLKNGDRNLTDELTEKIKQVINKIYSE